MKKILLFCIVTFVLPVTGMTDPQKSFFDAVQAKDITTLKNMIAKEPLIVNKKNEQGETALMLAVQQDNTAMVQELLLMQADINVKNKKGQTALTLAIDAGNVNMVQTLLKYASNVKIDQKDNNGDVPLMLAAKKGSIPLIEEILKEVPDFSTQELIAADKFASKFSDHAKIKELLESALYQYWLYSEIKNNKENYIPTSIKRKGVSLNVLSIERNPLAAAIRAGNLNIVKFLVEKGADVNLNLRGNVTPLLIAVEQNDTPIIEYLLEKKADPNTETLYGKTPLLEAQDSGVVELLVTKGKANINYQTSNSIPGEPTKMTVLMKAAELGKEAMVKKCLQLGADPLLKNSDGKTALDIATLESFDSPNFGDIIEELQKPRKVPTQPDQSLFVSLKNITQALKELYQALNKK